MGFLDCCNDVKPPFAVEDRNTAAVAHLAQARRQKWGTAFWVITNDKKRVIYGSLSCIIKDKSKNDLFPTINNILGGWI